MCENNYNICLKPSDSAMSDLYSLVSTAILGLAVTHTAVVVVLASTCVLHPCKAAVAVAASTAAAAESTVNPHAAENTRWLDRTWGLLTDASRYGGQPTGPTATEQRGITGVVVVFHWQAAGPVQPVPSQGSAARHVSRA